MTSRSKPTLSLYIHWPFCEKKCPYCDFNSHVRPEINQQRWKRALISEIATEFYLYPDRRISSLFFGGGTPSLMEPDTIAALLQAVDQYWGLEDNVEITLEANPSSVEKTRFKNFRSAGVNRLSIGAQSFDDNALKFLGRTHNAREVVEALDLARTTFPRYSFDLIYGRPRQSMNSWKEELTFALEFTNSHLSLYQLTIERGTPFFSSYRNKQFRMPNEDTAADQYEYTRDVLSCAGLFPYEVSNHAIPGEECQHNLTYWRYGDYAGIGPGAHGRISDGKDKLAYHRISNPEKWLLQTERTGTGLQKKTKLAPREVLQEMVFMGLRLSEGLDLEDVKKQTGNSIQNWVHPDILTVLIDEGLLVTTENKLQATQKGFLRLDSITSKLLAKLT
ncbi:MAG: radical SAM family heme chaperone HemW [Pseudomonadota bacterium]|nr:radical SAM family heme chaperone HemW [Pseudomonadota bacterium]